MEIVNPSSPMDYIIVICNIAMSICIFLIIYNIVKDNFYKVDERFDKLVGIISKRYSEKIMKESERKYLKSGKETFSDKLERVISSSRIRGFISFFNAEILVLLSILTSICSGIIAMFVKPDNIALIIESMILGVILPTLILQEMSISIFNKIDKDLEVLTIKGISHSKSKSTLVTIISKCEEYLTGPVKPVLTKLVNEINRGTPKEVAFNNAVESVENIRLKQLLTNLLITSQNDGDYKKVFNNAEESNRDYFDLKDMARDKINEGKSSIAGLAVASVAAVLALQKNFPDMGNVLNNTKFGQIIIAYFGVIIIFLIYKFFSFSKINY